MEKESGINCGIFNEHEPQIKKAARLINSARSPRQKDEAAEKFLATVNILLTCARYDEQNRDCPICRNISTLRKGTAELIIKASELAR